MIRVPGGTFRMGSDHHYPEEAPSHLVTVDSFQIDQTPVTNRQFAEFVDATGHVTFAETVPDPKNYPGSLPHLIFAGSLVFTPPKQRWICGTGANGGPCSRTQTGGSHTVPAATSRDSIITRSCT